MTWIGPDQFPEAWEQASGGGSASKSPAATAKDAMGQQIDAHLIELELGVFRHELSARQTWRFRPPCARMQRAKVQQRPSTSRGQGHFFPWLAWPAGNDGTKRGQSGQAPERGLLSLRLGAPSGALIEPGPKTSSNPR